MAERRANRLARAASPYLRQHQYNPVDWYEWGPEALERARREDKPILLSIGYSTCHWCHVMAHESFEDEDIAAVMNQHFVSIKVDREERPDLDETYMTAVQAMGGRGGWPLTVLLTPELKPFYGGTYFPPEDRGGLPGFKRLLLALSQAYHQNRSQIEHFSQRLAEQLQRLQEAPAPGGEPTREEAEQAAARLLQDFDPEHGGLGGAPKFPRSLELEFLLHDFRLRGDAQMLEKAAFSLEKMARGGIYDQLGGGFHRYAVDAAWVVPHFEKMLYDNALLAPLYLAVYQLRGSRLARRVAQETLDFLLRDLGAAAGGFYAALDAESEGEEGKFYVWNQAEVARIVGPDLTPLAAAALGVTAEGNFEGKNILTRPHSREELAAQFSMSPEAADAGLEEALKRLRQARARRVPPHRDEKVIVSWNALAISALARGAQILGEDRYHAAAARAARFILQDLVQEGRLHRSWMAGALSGPGFAEDYAFLAQALVDLYETDFDPAWVAAAVRLAAGLEELFLAEDGAYFYVGRDQEATLVRSQSILDVTLPSANSMAARVCLRLHRLTGKERYRDRALTILRRLEPQAVEMPWGFAHLWTAATLNLLPPLDLTLVGDLKDLRLQEMLREARRPYLPERLLVVKTPDNTPALEELSPPARSYTPLPEGPVAYLCQNFACRPPVAEARDLAQKLEDLKP
jgi:hypothetical protein